MHSDATSAFFVKHVCINHQKPHISYKGQYDAINSQIELVVLLSNGDDGGNYNVVVAVLGT